MKILMWLSIGLDRRTPSEHLLTAIVEALYEKGHTVHILQKSSGGDKPSLPDNMARLGVTTTCVSQIQAGKSNFVGRYLADLQYVMKCRKYLKTLEFDRVFMQSSNVAGVQTATLRQLHRNVPLTFNVQDIFPENAVYSRTMKKDSMPYRVLSAIQKKAYRDVDRIITISEDMKDQLLELGVDEDKISVIDNWSYQDEVYDPEQTTSEVVDRLMPEDDFNVVYAGNIGLMQNVEIVVETAAKMKNEPKIRFHIFGDGLYRKKLEARTQELGLENVVFHDMLPAEHAPALYCKADVNIIPLAENIYRTALPSKTATCLACQKPIILAIGEKSRFGHVLSKKTGCKITGSNDAEGMAKAILSIYEEKNELSVKEIFSQAFRLSANSAAYAQIIAENRR